MVETVQGYKWQTEAEGITAQNQLNEYFGIPVSPTSTTTQVIAIDQNEGDDPFWYAIVTPELINQFDVTEVLGDLETFDITT